MTPKLNGHLNSEKDDRRNEGRSVTPIIERCSSDHPDSGFDDPRGISLTTISNQSKESLTPRDHSSPPGVVYEKNTRRISARIKEVDWAGSWAWEIGGAVLSVICLALLIGFLRYVGGMSYAKWQYSISPNAVVSVITAFMKASMLVPLSACLSQLKWRQHGREKPTPLYSFHVLDQASRGPWGAMEVFWRIRSGFAMAGALLMVLSVAIDPFSQQILAFPSREVRAANMTTSVQRALEYRPDWGRTTSDWGVLDPTMQSALLTGLARINSPLDPVCPSNSCTYPDFASLGICSNCEDITKDAIQTCRPIAGNSSFWDQSKSHPRGPFLSTPFNCSYSFPRGFMFTPFITNMVLISDNELYAARQPFISTTTSSSDDLYIHPDMLVSFFSAKFSRDLTYTGNNASAVDEIPTMTNCTVFLCEKQYTESRVTTHSNTTRPFRNQPLPVKNITACIRGDTCLLAPAHGAKAFSANSTYSIEYETLSNLRKFMYMLFNTSLTQTDGTLLSGIQSSSFLYSSNNLTQSIDAMTTSMTDHIRSSDKSSAVRGWAYRVETYIRVRWLWLILPGITVTLSIVLFIAMARETRGHPVLWKSSVLPLLLGQMRVCPDHDFSILRPLDKLHADSRKIKVVLEEYEGNLLFTERLSVGSRESVAT